MERVRTLYDSYFLGIEKIEPQIARKEVHRMVMLYAQVSIRNSGQRFRFHSLQQKWNIHNTLWDRTVRQIEAGTYVRDVARVQRKAKAEGRDLPESVLAELKARKRRDAARGTGAPATKPTTEAAASAAPAPAPAGRAVAVGGGVPVGPADERSSGRATLVGAKPRATVPPSVAPPGVTDAEMKALYQRYQQAKKLTGGGDVKYEALLASVAKTTPGIMQKYNCAAVELSVVIKDDKVILKAVPKR
jgi:hypothetical protein